MSTPAKEIRAAVAELRTPLPPYLVGVKVRVIQGDSERMDCLAWCDADHSDGGDCDGCKVVEVLDPTLTRLIAALLTAREPIAAWLESWDDIEVREDGPMSEDCRYALTIARAVLGAVR